MTTIRLFGTMVLVAFLGIISSWALTSTVIAAQVEFLGAAAIGQFSLRFLPSIVKGGFYRKLAAYGHMGRMDIGLPWEVTDRAHLLRVK